MRLHITFIEETREGTERRNETNFKSILFLLKNGKGRKESSTLQMKPISSRDIVASKLLQNLEE